MMAEEAQDVKPKLNIHVEFEGQSALSPVPKVIRVSRVADQPSFTACTMKIKANTPFKKVFEAAEVRMYAAAGSSFSTN